MAYCHLDWAAHAVLRTAPSREVFLLVGMCERACSWVCSRRARSVAQASIRRWRGNGDGWRWRDALEAALVGGGCGVGRGGPGCGAAASVAGGSHSVSATAGPDRCCGGDGGGVGDDGADDD